LLLSQCPKPRLRPSRPDAEPEPLRNAGRSPNQRSKADPAPTKFSLERRRRHCTIVQYYFSSGNIVIEAGTIVHVDMHGRFRKIWSCDRINSANKY
jgi:hypothetical protein